MKAIMCCYLYSIPHETYEAIKCRRTGQRKPSFDIIVQFSGNRPKNISIGCCDATKQRPKPESIALICIFRDENSCVIKN